MIRLCLIVCFLRVYFVNTYFVIDPEMNTLDYNTVFEIESSPVFTDENQNSEFFPEWHDWGKHRQPEMYAEKEKNAFLFPRKNSEVDPENTENNLENEVKQFRHKNPYLKIKNKHKLPKPVQKNIVMKNDTHDKINNEEHKSFTDVVSAKNNISDYNENNNKSKSEEEIENFFNEANITEDSLNYSSEAFSRVHGNNLSIKKPKSQKKNYKSKNKPLKNSNYLHGPNLRHKERRNSFRFKKFSKSFYVTPAIPKLEIHNKNKRNLKSKIKKIVSLLNFNKPHKKEKNLRSQQDFQGSSLDIYPFSENREEQELLSKNLHSKFQNPNSLSDSKDVLGGKREIPGNRIREHVRSQLLPINSNALDSHNLGDIYIALDKSHSAITIMPTANEKGKKLKKFEKKVKQEKPIEVMLKDSYAVPRPKNIYDKNIKEIPFATEEYSDIDKIEMKSMPKVHLRSVKDFMPYFKYSRNLNLPPRRNQLQLHPYQKYLNNDEEPFINSIPPINQNLRNFNEHYLESSNNNNRHEKSLPENFKITHDYLDIPQVENYDDKLNLVKKLSKILEDFKVKEIILSDPKANRETNVIEDRKQNFVDNIRVFNTAHKKSQSNELPSLRLSTSGKQAITKVPKHFYETFTQNDDSIYSHETENLKEEKTGQKYPGFETDRSMYFTFYEDLEEVTSPFDSTEESFQIQSEKGSKEYNNYQEDSSLESNPENQDYYFSDMDENRNSKEDETSEDYNNKEQYDYNKDYDSSLYFQDNHVATPPMHSFNDPMPKHKKNRLHPSSQNLPKEGLHKTNFKIPNGTGSIQTKFYHFSTEISALGDGDEFQKEEVIEKESKTMLRNKLMSSNESSHQFEEKKTEIKDNKENYHEAFIQEKDHSKYPNKPDPYDKENFNVEERRSIGSTESQVKTNLIRKSIISDEKVPNWDHKLGKNHLKKEDKPIHSEKPEHLKSYPSLRENDLLDNVFMFSKKSGHRASPVDYYEYVTDEYEIYPENVSDHDPSEHENVNKRNDDNRNPSSAELYKLKFSRDTSNNSYANKTANNTDDISTTTVQQQNITTTTTELTTTKVSTESKSETAPSRSKKSYQEFKFNAQSIGSTSSKKRRNPDNVQELREISRLIMRSTESSELQDVNAALLMLNSMDKDKNILKKRDERNFLTTYDPEAENKTMKDLNLSNSGNVVYITISTTTMDLERRFNDFVHILEKKRSFRRSQRYPKLNNGKGRKRLATEKWTHFKS
ncbi:uncharacterized protein TNIN_218691 [Trichonephila inaurata madagascariensis]|uniref:Uncharacterized protein n=1 Tax=Trichonephila inaurata madagascariensis TaxID=2747483 RepID=A0A8X6MGQ5_9ARAC|nr:uncharacterized protein TNIN_218691 [Trichonephila inaurata madagascariensis]